MIDKQPLNGVNIMGLCQSQSNAQMPVMATTGGRKFGKVGVDPWTGEILISYCCPICDKFLNFGFTGQKDSCWRRLKWEFKTIKTYQIGSCDNNHKLPTETLINVQHTVSPNIKVTAR